MGNLQLLTPLQHIEDGPGHGPALIVGGTALNQVWLFIVAPLIGGAVAAGLRRMLYPEPQPQALASGEIPAPSLG